MTCNFEEKHANLFDDYDAYEALALCVSEEIRLNKGSVVFKSAELIQIRGSLQSNRRFCALQKALWRDSASSSTEEDGWTHCSSGEGQKTYFLSGVKAEGM
jgi:hypothetical protein